MLRETYGLTGIYDDHLVGIISESTFFGRRGEGGG